MFEFFKKKKQVKEVDDNIVGLPAGDAVLKACKKKAQEEIQYLIDFICSHEQNEELYRYVVKANFVEDGESEHMWVQVSGFKDGCFIGRLANEPQIITLIKYGDPVKVLKKNVEDWILEDFVTDTKVGEFSSQYINSKKS
jgi:uncharacterized protein YegJ (DUF2314 family)